MDAKKFSKSMDMLANVYRGKFALKPDDKDEVKKSIYESWFVFFGDCDSEAFDNAVKWWISKKTMPPTVHDLKLAYQEEYYKVKKQREEAEREEERKRSEEYWKKLTEGEN